MSRDKNKELMLAAGSKDGAYDIEAPDQWRWVLRHAKDAHEKAMNWVKSKTTAFRHESPYCVDEHGNELYLDHAAVELGWELQTARNVFCQLEAQGRIRLQKGKRIWYCADVPQAYAPAQEQTDQGPADDADDPTETNENGRTNGEGNNRVHSYWASYVVDFIESLPSAQKVAAKRKLRAYPKWRQEFLADGLAALRSIADRYEDSTLREIGIPKKRLPKRRPAECKWVQLSLLEEPNFVHGYSETTEPDSVQSAPDSVQTENPGLHTVENGGPSLLSSSATTTTTSRSVGSREPTDLPTGAGDLLELPSIGRLVRKLKDKPTSKLRREILTTLRGAPLFDLDSRVAIRFAAITSFGMVKHLARDVGDAFAAAADHTQADQREYQQQQQRLHTHALQILRDGWASFTAGERAGYLEIYPELANGRGASGDD